MLNVKLLGQFNVQYRSATIDIRERKYQSLFSYLILLAGTKHRREHLARQLWPDASMTNARNNLRHGLWRLRKVLTDAGANSDDFLLADDVTVTFNSHAAYVLDVQEITRACRRPAAPIEILKHAAELYAGDLLPGFENEDNHDDWVLMHRTRVKHEFDQLMNLLMESMRNQECWSEIPSLAYQWITHGYDIEHAFREKMIAHYALRDMTSVWASYDECCKMLSNRYGTEPSDETELLLKQLIDSVYVLKSFQRPMNDGAKQLARAHPITIPPHNLIVPTTPFVEREADLNDLTTHFGKNASRLVTLMGAGGIGKTRLAVEGAMQLLNRDPTIFPDGIFLVRLESATTPDAMIAAIADVLHLSASGQESQKSQVWNFLREKSMLLLLDNFEQLLLDGVDVAALIDELLNAAPQVRLLVTSRERLHIEREHLIELDGLSYPEMDESDDLEHFGAVQLFIQTARRIYPHFDLAIEKKGVAMICQMTQGMPLAIELAAAWVRTLSCSAIASRISRNLDALSADQPELPIRHRSIRAVLNATWKMLSPMERNSFAALSVFRGGFKLDAAEEVAQATVSQLYSLVDKSLIKRTPAGRYEMHELIRQFGEEKLDAAEDSDWSDTTVHARMARFFLSFLKSHAQDYDALEQEWANLQAAMRAAHERYEWAIVTELAQALIKPWFTRARFTDAREGLALASMASSADDDLQALALILRWRGRACIEQGDYEEAETHLRAGLSLCTTLGLEVDAARHKYELARISLECSDHAEARRLVNESIDALQHSDDEESLAAGIFLLARMHFLRQEYADALPLCEKSLNIQQHLNDQRSCISTLNLLALLMVLTRDANPNDATAQANAYCRQAYTIANAQMDKGELAIVLYTTSQVERRSGKLPEAREHAVQSLRLLRQMGDRKSQANLLYQLSWVDADLGSLEEALDEARQGLRMYRELKDEWAVPRLLLHMGDILSRLDRKTEACGAWQEGEQLADSIKHPVASTLAERLRQNAD